ncbi:unnamed protein product [Linum tenue]|uniref:Uncharacterized protein n=1 Tax=Linum tenue TaxID=586396 RepID=A0AAV0H6L3_9ROSI|nr:unnamed protein product [Linum tenue]
MTTAAKSRAFDVDDGVDCADEGKIGKTNGDGSGYYRRRGLTREGMASEKKSHRRQALVTVPPVDSSE